MATDVLDIALDGLALDQIVDLYNYWQQLKAPEGESYRVAVLEKDEALTAAYQLAKATSPAALLAYKATLYALSDVVIDEPSGTVRRINLNHFSNEIYNDKRREGLGIDINTVTVVGHSLDGHLAAAFSRLFPGVISDYVVVSFREVHFFEYIFDKSDPAFERRQAA